SGRAIEARFLFLPALDTRSLQVVAACGLAGGLTFPETVAPFILRGVTLVGIDSVMCPRAERLEAWRRLAQDLDPSLLEAMTQRRSLSAAIRVAEKLLAGAVRGRVIVPIARIRPL